MEAAILHISHQPKGTSKEAFIKTSINEAKNHPVPSNVIKKTTLLSNYVSLFPVPSSLRARVWVPLAPVGAAAVLHPGHAEHGRL